MNDMDDSALIAQTVADLEREGRLGQLRDFTQHGQVSVYEHSVRVAALSLKIARRLPVKPDRQAMVRGALLHDYFLYDWHVKDPDRPLHAFYHPKAALENARQDYEIGPIEADVIGRHMFPVVPLPPRTLEGWIVNFADTLCAVEETVRRRRS